MCTILIDSLDFVYFIGGIGLFIIKENPSVSTHNTYKYQMEIEYLELYSETSKYTASKALSDNHINQPTIESFQRLRSLVQFGFINAKGIMLLQ
jgi:hypothetical protein